jgi:hypothetical protein
MLAEHAPFNRIISDQATAIDRQWLRMMNEAFAGVSFENLMRAGFDAEAATALLGVVALDVRLNSERQS